MTTQETKFWEKVIATSNPGWGVTVDPQWGAEGNAFSNTSVQIYVFDTKTCWKAAGATTVADLTSAKAQIIEKQGLSNSIANAASIKIEQAADAKANSDSLLTKQSILLAIGYLTSTRTYEVVLETMKALDGHWLVLLYRLNDGTLLARPTFTEGKHAGSRLMSQTELLKWVKDVVYADTTIQSTSVYKTFSNSKGVDLSVAFQ